MKTENINISGMHCNSCEKTIARSLKKEGIIVERIEHTTGKATITHEDLSPEHIAQSLRACGYDLKGVKSAPLKAAYETEKGILANGVLLTGVLLALQAALAFFIYRKLPLYREQELTLVLLIPIALAINIIAIWHQRAYRRDVSCMTGMMVGMTIGMTTGFTIGAIAGLMNGMFIGSVIGLTLGIIAGIYAGKCCGIMGIMEGMMAGLMGGTMGAMMSVMLIADHPIAFLIILITLCAVILGGLMVIIVREHAGAQHEIQPWPLPLVLFASAAAMFTLSAILLILPRGLW